MGERIFSNTIFKIVAGVFSVIGIVFLIQWISGFISEKLTGNGELFNLIIAIIQCCLSVWCYRVLYGYFEKRQITELSSTSFVKNAVPGFLTGIVMQSIIILVIYMAGGYAVTHINPASFMLPAFTAALTAGFVAEIVIRGILFRLVEEKLGTVISMGIMTVLFMVLHLGGKGATLLSVLAVSMQAGFLLSATYVLTRNLWFPIFLHFAWDFAEPGIFGAINPGNTVEKSLFACHISGPNFLTGGTLGPVNSFQSLLLCFLAGSVFLWLAWQKKSIIFPYRKKIENH
jgi:uncharacterized protein